MHIFICENNKGDGGGYGIDSPTITIPRGDVYVCEQSSGHRQIWSGPPSHHYLQR